jgi:hypothetical protein
MYDNLPLRLAGGEGANPSSGSMQMHLATFSQGEKELKESGALPPLREGNSCF